MYSVRNNYQSEFTYNNKPSKNLARLLGKKYTVGIFYAFRNGARYFSDFLDIDRSLSRKVLNDRLKEMISMGLIKKEKFKNNKIVFRYELTNIGIVINEITVDIENISTKIDNRTNKLETLEGV